MRRESTSTALCVTTPDLFDDVTAGSAVLTVYLSAGDAGRQASYWEGRERGAMAAHARMVGAPDAWTASDGGIPGRVSTRMTLDADADVRLLFLRLPDGFNGCGSCPHGSASLQRLWQGDIEAMRSVDGAQTWDRAGLVAGLAAVMDQHQPTKIRILDPVTEYRAGPPPDHSDHLSAGRFAMEAIAAYGRGEVHAYRGYPMQKEPENLPPALQRLKQHVFSAYAAHDPKVPGEAEAARRCQAGKLCYPGLFARRYEVPLTGAKPGSSPLACPPCEPP